MFLYIIECRQSLINCLLPMKRVFPAPDVNGTVRFLSDDVIGGTDGGILKQEELTFRFDH